MQRSCCRGNPHFVSGPDCHHACNSRQMVQGAAKSQQSERSEGGNRRIVANAAAPKQAPSSLKIRDLQGAAKAALRCLHQGGLLSRFRPRRGSLRHALVAQLDRAPDYESGGQEFESLRARHFLPYLNLFWPPTAWWAFCYGRLVLPGFSPANRGRRGCWAPVPLPAVFGPHCVDYTKRCVLPYKSTKGYMTRARVIRGQSAAPPASAI
jgi:hypothetical protein